MASETLVGGARYGGTHVDVVDLIVVGVSLRDRVGGGGRELLNI